MDQHTSGTGRDLGAVQLALWGRVVPVVGVVAFEVVGDDGRVVQPISEFLRDFKARSPCSAFSDRSASNGLRLSSNAWQTRLLVRKLPAVTSGPRSAALR